MWSRVGPKKQALMLAAAVIVFALVPAVAACSRNTSTSPWPGARVHDENDTTFQVRIGQQFAMVVPTRPRLDLYWTESHDSQRLTLVDTLEDTGPNGLQGGYGRMWFLFAANAAGQTKVTLVYQGPGAPQPAETVVFTIDVR